MKVEADLGSDLELSLDVQKDFYFVNRIWWEEDFGQDQNRSERFARGHIAKKFICEYS